MTTVTREKIVLMAEESFKNKGSVDVIQISDLLGVEVYAVEKADHFTAKIQYSKNDSAFHILVNSNHPRTRQRFSIAHELAHYIKHNKMIVQQGSMNRKNGGNLKIEKEADELAAEILMPQKTVISFMKKMKVEPESIISHATILKLSEKFSVSYLVAAIRLRSLKFYVPYIEFA